MNSLSSELDRLLAPKYLDGLDQRSLSEIRSMRAECQSAETAISYLRRIAQGRLDIVHAYLDDEGSASSPGTPLVEQLPRIMAGPERPPGPGRLPAQMSPELYPDLTKDVDAVCDAACMTELPDMSRDRLLEVAQGLSAAEKRTSEQRRSLHERIDKLQAEIVSRYKTGEATVEGLLA